MLNNLISKKESAKKLLKLANMQVYQLSITLAKVKSMAIIVGSFGAGINNIILATLATFQQFSSFGLHQSALRVISSESNIPFEKRYSYSAYKKLVIFSSFLGFLLCLIMSPWLSQMAFNSSEYQLSFACASISIIFMGVGAIYLTLMQSEGRVDLFIKSSLVSALLSLIFSIPILILMKIEGVVVVIIASSFFFWITCYFYSSQTNKNLYAKCSWMQLIEHGTPLIKQGFVLMISNTIMALIIFLLNAYIVRDGGVKDVGLYQSALNIVALNLAIVNTSIASDFFPRISASITKKLNISRIIYDQMEIVVIAIVPISVFLMALSPTIIKMILTDEFLPVALTLQIMASALLFRVIWNILGYCILANGDNRTYLLYDTMIGHVLNFVLSLIFYKEFGLIGLGISYLLGSVISAAMLIKVVKSKYGYNPINLEPLNAFLILAPIAITLLTILYVSEEYKNIILSILLLFAAGISFLKFKKIMKVERNGM